MHVTSLIYRWPHEAQYACDPDTYDGGDIEHYDFAMTSHAPEIGETKAWENQLWTIAHVEHYAPSKGGGFSVAILSLDGEMPVRVDNDDDCSRHMYVCIAPDDYVCGWPIVEDIIPDVGSQPNSLPGWEVSAIYEFLGRTDCSYDWVRVCWCAPIQSEKAHSEQRGLAEVVYD